MTNGTRLTLLALQLVAIVLGVIAGIAVFDAVAY